MDLPRASRDRRIEAADVGGGEVLYAFTHHNHMSEPELTDDGRKERHAALLRLDEREPEVRPDDRHRML